MAEGASGSSAENLGETVLDEILVSARLSIGLERLRLIFTSERIIVAHMGKRGGGALALTSLVGFLASGLEDLVKSGRESAKKKKLKESGPQEVLESDKDNFVIRYAEVVSVKVVLRDGQILILLLTGKDKLEFYTGASVDRLKSVLDKVLRDKLVITSERTPLKTAAQRNSRGR
jgi:hypothetical protein